MWSKLKKKTKVCAKQKDLHSLIFALRVLSASNLRPVVW